MSVETQMSVQNIVPLGTKYSCVPKGTLSILWDFFFGCC